MSVPADAEESKFASAVIVPGFIDTSVSFGVGGPVSSPVAFGSKLGDRLLPSDPAIGSVRQGGTTTVLLSGPAPSSVLAFKLTDKPRVVREPVCLRFALRGNLTSAGSSLRETLQSGKAYADGWTQYAADLAAYEVKKKEFDAAQAKTPPKKDDKTPAPKRPEPPKKPEEPQVVTTFEPYRALFAGKLPMVVEARREDAIRLAVKICRDEFNLRTALVGADDAHRVVDLLAEKSVTVILGPELVRTVDREEVNSPMSLAVRGVPLAFQSNAAAGARNLPLAVGYSVRKGLGSDDALRGLTATPAEFLGLDSLGTIAKGKDADVVVLSGMPFESSTRVLAVMINGRWVYRSAD
jgi:imidazolonepropionase-like amidohydrolase